jgi:hypothetical protein
MPMPMPMPSGELSLGSSPSDNSRTLDFLVQAAANAVGTIASGILLGGVAVRLGLLDVNDDRLYQTANYSAVAGVLVAILAIVSVITLLALGRIEPHRRDQHRMTGLKVLEVAAAGGIAATTVFWAALSIAYADPENVVVWLLIVAPLGGLIVLLRAYRRRLNGM